MPFAIGDRVIVRHMEAAGSGKEPHDREGVVLAQLPSGVYRVDIGGLACLYAESAIRLEGTDGQTFEIKG